MSARSPRPWPPAVGTGRAEAVLSRKPPSAGRRWGRAGGSRRYRAAAGKGTASTRRTSSSAAGARGGSPVEARSGDRATLADPARAGVSSAAKSVSFPANPARRACRGGAEVAGGEAVGLAEGAVEGGQAAEAPGEGDLGHRARRGQGIGERRAGRLEAAAQDVPGEALARALEQAL